MPKLLYATPKYRHHKSSGQALVTLCGVDHYLGQHGSKASKRAYDRLIGEWLAAGRRLPPRDNELTIVELCAAYWEFAKGYYRKDGQPTRTIERVRIALRCLKGTYGPTSVTEFGPLSLQSLQKQFVRDGKSRRYANFLIAEIKRAFKWGVAQELVPAEIWHAMATVHGLRKGRTEAPEPEPVLPVPDDLFASTLPYLPPVVAAMVKFQRFTGCRPGEVCQLRPCDLDHSGKVWRYRPASHKTEHHGHERVIFVGPKAQKLLLPYLRGRKAEDFCFVPAESEAGRRQELHAKRQTPLADGNRPGTHRVRRPKRKPGERYDGCAYARAVLRACDKAFPPPADPSDEEAAAWRKAHRWSPNRLRHTAATEIRQKYGLEAAQVVLGHSRADVTQVYAERDQGLAARIMGEVG